MNITKEALEIEEYTISKEKDFDIEIWKVNVAINLLEYIKLMI